LGRGIPVLEIGHSSKKSLIFDFSGRRVQEIPLTPCVVGSSGFAEISKHNEVLAELEKQRDEEYE